MTQRAPGKAWCSLYPLPITAESKEFAISSQKKQRSLQVPSDDKVAQTALSQCLIRAYIPNINHLQGLQESTSQLPPSYTAHTLSDALWPLGLRPWGTVAAQPLPSREWGVPSVSPLALFCTLEPAGASAPPQRNIPMSLRERRGCTLPGDIPASKGVDLTHLSN